MTACPVCGVDQTPVQYCVVLGDFHATFGSHFVSPRADTILANTDQDGRCFTCGFLATHSATDCPDRKEG